MEEFERMYEEKKRREDEKAAMLVAALLREGRQNEMFKASANARYRELLYKEFGI